MKEGNRVEIGKKYAAGGEAAQAELAAELVGVEQVFVDHPFGLLGGRDASIKRGEVGPGIEHEVGMVEDAENLPAAGRIFWRDLWQVQRDYGPWRPPGIGGRESYAVAASRQLAPPAAGIVGIDPA